MTDAQAIAHLEASIEKYKKLEQPGYNLYRLSNEVHEDSYLSALKPISFNLVNALVKMNLLTLIELEFIRPAIIPNFLHFSDDFKQEEINKLKSDDFKGFLKSQINNHLNKVTSILTSLGCQDTTAWLYKIITGMPRLVEENKYDCSDKAKITQFEVNFENTLINPNLVNTSDSVLNYKKSLLSKAISKENLIEESEIDEDSYSASRQFRLKVCPNEKNIIDIFNNKISKEKIDSDYFLVKIFFDTRERIKALKAFYPIIQFTNYLLKEFSHNITRNDARETQIKFFFTEEKPECKKYFEEFLKAWNELPVDSFFYDCHEIKKIDINEETELAALMPDSKELGGGMMMAAAIMYLSEMQNQILELILKEMKFINEKGESLLDNTKYPPQAINEDSVLAFDILDSDQLREFYINNWEYGKGTDIIYDFEKLQNSILNDVYKKKFINPTKIHYIQYQFELLMIKGDEADAVLEIRRTIKQEPMELKKIKEIENFFDQLAFEQKLKSKEVFKEIYTSMNCLLYFLKSSREEGKTMIYEYWENLKNNKKISKYLTESTNSLGKLQLCYVIECFCIIELFYFPHFCKEILKEEFKKNTQKDIIDTIISAIVKDKVKRYPSFEDMKKSVLRFIIRCSVADLDVNQPISYYIKREDFWDSGIDDEKIDNFNKMLEDNKIAIFSSYCLHQALHDYINKPPEVKEINKKEKKPSKREEGKKQQGESKKNKKNKIKDSKDAIKFARKV